MKIDVDLGNVTSRFGRPEKEEEMVWPDPHIGKQRRHFRLQREQKILGEHWALAPCKADIKSQPSCVSFSLPHNFLNFRAMKMIEGLSCRDVIRIN